MEGCPCSPGCAACAPRKFLCTPHIFPCRPILGSQKADGSARLSTSALPASASSPHKSPMPSARRNTATSAHRPALSPAPAAPPKPLPGLEDVPEELRPLFTEMQQFGMNSSVQLRGISPLALRELYEKASKRLESLPTTLCRTSTGDMVQLPLPGRRGVAGWRVDEVGNVR